MHLIVFDQKHAVMQDKCFGGGIEWYCHAGIVRHAAGLSVFLVCLAVHGEWYCLVYYLED